MSGTNGDDTEQQPVNSRDDDIVLTETEKGVTM